MANKLNIVISAVDNATKTINRINRQFANAMLPVTRLNLSIAGLARASGVTKLAKGFVGVAKAASNVAEKVGSIMAPMAAIVGVGSIAGVIALATEWAKLGQAVTNSAANIGMSASQLMGLQGTARLAGVSAEELTSNLTSLGNTMEDALYGRNQGALMLMNRLGVSMHRLKNGSVDTQRAMQDLARVMQRPGIKGNAQVENLIASTFGVSGLLPLLRKGPEAIEEYQKKVRELGGEMSGPAIQAAAEFEQHLTLLQTAVGGLRNSIGSALIPVFQPLIDQLTAWISANRELIASKVAEYARKIADWVKTIDFKRVFDDITGLVKGVTNFVEAIGGWKVALGLVLAMMGAPLLTAIAQLGSALVSLGAVVWANPILAALGAIGFLSYEIYQHWDKIKSVMGSNASAGLSPGTEGALDPSMFDGSDGGSKPAPLGIRRNNPLNMTLNGHERTYSDPVQGIAAAVANLERNYRGLSIAQIQDKWTGGARTGNTPLQIANYTRLMTAATGLNATDVPDLSDPRVVSKLAVGMIRAENGQQPYSPTQLGNATVAGMQQAGMSPGQSGGNPMAIDVHVHGLPPGAGVSVQQRDQFGPSKVAYSMPMGGTP
ncbi:hypothetical protein Q8F57_003185 [Paraburkholderia terrae]|uniref:hypothetical protein n=1 Tax=Paraburkholderia terrae TaxID=311230 RepID=UPI00296B0AEB|nr:hypothetical protein [Paraburkholderia terrae]MDW3655471.1 hypothetical protein [Paraburkholderia terrae]